MSLSKIDDTLDIELDLNPPIGGSSGGYSISSGSSISSGTIVGSGGFTTASGGLASNNAQYGFANSPVLQGSIQMLDIDMDPPRDGKLPPATYADFDDARNPLRITLDPENTISTHEMFLITRMMFAYIQKPMHFSVYKFIVKNNLERHFKIEL